MNIPFVRFVDRNVGIPLCRLLAPLGRSRATAPPQADEVARIAVLKFVGIGNLVLASPTLASLRRRFPGARITFVTLAANRRILETNTDVDELFYFDAGSLWSVVASSWRLFWHLRRGGYGVVVDLEPFSRFTALISYLSGVRSRVGFDTPGQARGRMYNLPVPYAAHLHIVEAFHMLAERLGAPVGRNLELTPIHYSLADEAVVESFALRHGIDPTRPLIGIHAGTGDNATVRRWPPERFGELADALIEEYGAQVVFTGSPKEAPLVASAMAAMRHPAADASGQLSIPQLAGLATRCALFISGDTGPLHIAAAMRTPVLGLYGPNTPRIYGPWGKGHTTIYHRLQCSPCISNLNDKLTRCTHGECIQSVTTAEVLQRIRMRYGSLLRAREAAVAVLAGD